MESLLFPGSFAEVKLLAPVAMATGWGEPLIFYRFIRECCVCDQALQPNNYSNQDSYVTDIVVTESLQAGFLRNGSCGGEWFPGVTWVDVAHACTREIEIKYLGFSPGRWLHYKRRRLLWSKTKRQKTEERDRGQMKMKAHVADICRPLVVWICIRGGPSKTQQPRQTIATWLIRQTRFLRNSHRFEHPAGVYW